MATDTKKPKWSAVTFGQIEKRREALKISKSAMANLLGITNSTYHNWQRDTTVPHPAQQEQIKAALGSLTAESTPLPKLTRGTHEPKAAPAKKPGRKAASNGATKRRLPERSPRTRENVAGGTPMQGFTTTHPFFLSPGQSVPGSEVTGIATITAAYITSQSSKGPVDKQTVFDFISGLQKALHSMEQDTPTTAPKVEEPEPATT